jgi:candidapepsin
LKALVVVHFLKIDRSSVSIYLGADDHDVANAEMVLGGSYDKAKLGRELFTMEMVDPHSVCLTNTATNSVNVTSIEGVSDGKTVKSDSPTSEGTPFLLDTEAPLVERTLRHLQSYFDRLWWIEAMTLHYTYMVDCKYRDPANSDGNITVQFAQGGKVYVPFHTLVTGWERNLRYGYEQWHQQALGRPVLAQHVLDF